MDTKADKLKWEAAQLSYFKEVSGLMADEVTRLLRKFSRLRRELDVLNEHDCNRGLSAFETSREKVLVDDATNIALQLKCGLHHQGDPRGPAIRLIRPDKRSNLMDGETWHVTFADDEEPE